MSDQADAMAPEGEIRARENTFWLASHQGIAICQYSIGCDPDVAVILDTP